MTISDATKEAIKLEVSLAELRLRNWILAGLITNVIAWLPVIFFFGAMNEGVNQLVKTQADIGALVIQHSTKIENNRVRGAHQEAWMIENGYRPIPEMGLPK